MSLLLPERPEQIDNPTHLVFEGLRPISSKLSFSQPIHEPVTPDKQPTQLGQYIIVREISRGGMGIVYEGYDSRLRRSVAIKVPRPSWLGSDEVLQRFQMEAEAMAQVQHANIVAVHEVGRDQGRPFVAMELLSGGSLLERIQGRPLAPREAARIFCQLASGMAHAHAHGILHRDLKPGNVLFTQDDVPKIIDFGAVRFTDEHASEADSNLTQVGTVIGTPQYMAPEQASGDPNLISPLADIYSLGAILYELLTGVPPFNGVNPYDIITSVRTKEPVPPSLIQPKLPRDLETICLKCLEKEPARRYQSAQELYDDLQRFLNDEPITARPTSPFRRLARTMKRNPSRVGLALGLLIASLVGLCAFIYQFDQTLDALEQAQNQANEAQIAQLDADQQRIDAQQASREASLQKAEALKHLETAKWNLYRTQIVQAQHFITSSNVLAAEQVLFSTDEDYRNWEWRYLAYRTNDTIWSQHVSSTESDAQIQPMWIHRQAISPDGRYLALGIGNPYILQDREPSDNPGGLVLCETLTGKVVFQQDGLTPKQIQEIVWRDDDHLILVDHGANVLVWNRESESVLHKWDWKSDDFMPTAHGIRDNLIPCAISGKGRTVARYRKPMVFEVFDPLDPASRREIGSQNPGMNPVHFSQDGRFLLLARSNARHEVQATHILRTDTFQEVFRLPGSVHSLHLCPNGNWLIGTEKPADQVSIVTAWNTTTWQKAWSSRVQAQSGGAVRFSPDSRWMAVYHMGRVSFRLHNLATGESVDCHGMEGSLRAMEWSPDGRYIAAAGDDSTVRIWNPRSGKLLTTLKGHKRSVRALAFSQDGHHLFSGGADQQICCWDLLRPESAGGLMSNPRVNIQGTYFGAMRFDTNNQLNIFDTKTGLMQYDPRSGNLMRRVPLHTAAVRDAKELTDSNFSTDGMLVCGKSVTAPNAVGVWNTSTGEEVVAFETSWSHLLSANLSPDGRFVSATGVLRDPESNQPLYQVALWEISSGQIRFLKTFPTPAISVQFDPFSERVAFGFACRKEYTGPSVWLCDLTGQELQAFGIEESEKTQPGFRCVISTLAFSPRGEWLLVNDHASNCVSIIETRTRSVIHKLIMEDSPTCMVFSADGQRLAIVGYTSRVKLFDTNRWEEIITLSVRNDRENDYAFPAKVAFSPDGNTLAANHWNGEITFWHVENLIGTHLASRSVENGAAFRFHLESARESLQLENCFAFNFHCRNLYRLMPPTPALEAEWKQLKGELHSRNLLPALAGGMVSQNWQFDP